MSQQREAGFIQDDWFHERNSQWPGIAMSLQFKPETLVQEQTKFQKLICFESVKHGKVLILDGAIQCVERDEFAYQEMITNLAMMSHPNPRHVLVIGGGDGGVLREIFKHESVEKADLCDIDEAVPKFATKYLPEMAQGLSNPKANVVIGDGLAFVKEAEDKYDVIITDSSDPDGPARALFEKPYFEDLYKALKPNGVICNQAENFWNDMDLITTIKKNCKDVFPVVDWAWASTPTYPYGIIGFIVASKDASQNVKEPARKYSREDEEAKFRYYNQDIHSSSFVLPTWARKAINGI